MKFWMTVYLTGKIWGIIGPVSNAEECREIIATTEFSPPPHFSSGDVVIKCELRDHPAIDPSFDPPSAKN